MLSTGDILTHIFHITIFTLANAAFVYAVYYRLKLASKGQKVDNLASIEARLRSFLFNVLFQKKLFKHPVRGLMHAFIFYGFVIYGVHTTSQMVAGNGWSFLLAAGISPYEFWIPEFTYLGLDLTEGQALLAITGVIAVMALTFVAYFNLKVGKNFSAQKSPGIQWAFLLLLMAELGAGFAIIIGSGAFIYEAVVQNFSLLVLTGLGYFAYRRWIRRAKGLDIPSAQSAIVILMIGTLMVSTLIGSAAQVSLNAGAHASWVNNVVLKLLGLLGMDSTVEAEAVRNFSWWVHIMTVYIFMVYVPNSKHGHLIFAPINFFMVKDQPIGTMNYIDLESETAVWGAGNVTELPWTSMIDGLSCIECGRCTVECPANRTGKPLDPKKIMVDLKHSMLDHSKAIMSHNPEEGPAPSPVIGDPYITDEELWACTSCAACVEACPVGNNQLEAILEMRRNLVLAESRMPQELQNAFVNMENNSNPWGVGAHTRADWADGLGVKTLEEDPNIDVLYWTGCAASFDDRNKTIARSFVKVMQAANVNFGILGAEEGCTGDSARRGGNEYLYQMLAQTNVETLNKYNVKKIVTACPHCFNTLKNEYPQFGGNFDVQHHSDFIEDLINDGKIEMDEKAVEEMQNRRGTYHDSCYLGRYNDVYEQPRNTIRAALGMDIAEASDSHKTSLCCGAGGAQMWMEEQYERVNNKRTQQLIDTGADTIATACPFCMIMISDGVKNTELQDVKVLDIAELVAASMKGGTGAISGGFASKEAASAEH